ncbi:MAG: hypothetical protein WKG07_10860 [Hymenobacter sp.]
MPARSRPCCATTSLPISRCSSAPPTRRCHCSCSRAGRRGPALQPQPEPQQRGPTPEPGNSYPAAALALPVGGGFTLRASPQLALTAEALYYFTTTDLLDDVSQRGNPKATDGLVTVTLKAEFSFKKGPGKPLVRND